MSITIDMPKRADKSDDSRVGRPATGNIQISIRLPKMILDKLTMLAERDFLTKSQVIARLIKAAE